MAVAVSDILSYGRDREPRGPRQPRWSRRPRGPRWRRWQRIAAVTGLVLALAAVFIWSLPSLRQPSPQQAGPRTSLGAVVPSPAAPSALPTTPAQMTGQPLPRNASLRLLLGGRGPAWLSVATGETGPVRGLPGGDDSYQLIRLAGGWAAQPFSADAPGCDNCAVGPLPVYYVADGSRGARRIGAADVVAPAAAADALWLMSYRRGVDMGAATAQAQEVSVTGAALGPRLTLPAGYVIDQGTRAGLLLMPELTGSGPVRAELWDPGTRQVKSSFVNLVAASAAEIAWRPGCTASCPVRVLDLTGDQVRQFPLPARSLVYAGAFSADGRLLALQVTAGFTGDGRPAATRLMVATVVGGQITAVPGTTVGSGDGVAFGWQPGSDQLIADVSLDAQGPPNWQIAVWRPGDARLSTALVQVPDGSWPVIDQGPY